MDRYKTVDNANADKRSIYDEGLYRNAAWLTNELNTLTRKLAAAEAKIAALEAKLVAIQSVVDEQAEDSGLWFRATTASEAYLQQSLRLLTDAVEGLSDG